MFLILAQDADAEAGWLHGELGALDLEPLELVRASQLVHGAVWQHRIGAKGTHTVLELADGRVIDSAAVGGIVNRLAWVGANGFRGASEHDREYAGMELYALVQSWLEGFGARAINRPAPSGLSGAWHAADHWRWLARGAGLPVGRHDSTEPAWQTLDGPDDERWAVVLDECLLPGREPPRDLIDGCTQLAAAARADLLGVRFRRATEGWEFADATFVPSLVHGGRAAAARVASALRARAAA